MKGHNSFKLFVGKFENGTFSQDEANAFINGSEVAPRSLGIEFLESTSEVVLSVGYESTDSNTGHELTLVELGELDTKDFSALEARMSEEASKLDGIICHEFFVNNENQVFSLFLTSK